MTTFADINRNYAYMRKLLMLPIAALMLASCGETMEDKAEVLIEKEMQGTLHNPDTYDALETKVDSAFAPDDNPAVFAMLAEIGSANISISQCEANIAELKKNMENAEVGIKLMSKRKGDKYREGEAKYKKLYDECITQIDKLRSAQDTVGMFVEKRLMDVKAALDADRAFVGFKAVHRYSAKNKDGKELTENYCYFFDKDMSRILFNIPQDKYELLKKSFKDIRETLSAVRSDSVK